MSTSLVIPPFAPIPKNAGAARRLMAYLRYAAELAELNPHVRCFIRREVQRKLLARSAGK